MTKPLLPYVDRILFLPDDTAEYDFNTDQIRDNVRMPLINDRRVDEYCSLSAERTAILNSIPGIGGYVTATPAQAMRLNSINSRQSELLESVQRDYDLSGRIGRNDPCPCGSGKKYKKCCGVAT